MDFRIIPRLLLFFFVTKLQKFYMSLTGTGKTNMGIKLVVLFNDINRKIEENGGGNSQIIYCGPSNKSVDLVASELKFKFKMMMIK